MPLRHTWVSSLAGLFCAIAIIAIPFMSAQAASLTDLNNQLAQAESSLAYYQQLQQNEQTKSNQYQSQIATAQAQIQSVQADINSLQAQISTKQNAISSTQSAIDQKIKDINQKNDDLNQTIVDYYIYTNTSYLNQGTVQDDLSHYADQSEYMEVLHSTIDAERAALDQAKQSYQKQESQLQQQRDELAALKGQAESQNADLVNQKNQTVSLLNQSLANTQIYKQSADNVSGQIAEIRRKIDAATNVVIGSGGTGGYPYANWTIDVPDAYGEYTRECTSFASWYWAAHEGKSITNGTYHGNADEYGGIARARGYHTTSNPNTAGAGAIVMWANFGGVGHVAIVTAVNSDGTIDTAEYNSYGDHNYHTFSHLSYESRGSATFIY